MKSKASPTPERIPCPSCGHPNPWWSYVCENCDTKLELPDETVYTRSLKRPGFLTAWAIFTGVVAVIVLVGGILAGINLRENVDFPRLGRFVFEGALSLSILWFVLAWGLWQRRNWARWVVMVLLGLVVGINLVIGLGAQIGAWDSFYGYPTHPPLVLCAALACIGACVVMIYWFIHQENEFL